MADIQVDLKELRKAVAREVGKKALPIIMAEAIRISKSKIREEFIRSFRRTIVGKALRGLYDGVEGKDLIAHMGLDVHEGMPATALREIEEVLRQSISVTDIYGRNDGRFSSTSDATTLGFNISISNLEEQLVQIPNAEYNSENSKGNVTSIPWMQWLLFGGDVLGFRVVFNSYAGTDVFSRSERAIMVKSDSYDWDTDDYDNFSESGKNFVQDMLEDYRWKDNVLRIISKAIQTVVDTEDIDIK